MFRNAHGENNRFIYFLGIFTIELDPAAVAGAHGIGVVTVDVDIAGEGAVDYRHDNGQPQGSGNIEYFMHQG